MSKRGVLLFLVVLLAFAPAVFGDGLFARGGVSDAVFPEAIGSGSNLPVVFTVSNEEQYPFPDGYIVVDLVQGSSYFDGTNSADFIRREYVIRDVSLRAGERKNVSGLLAIPSGISPGNYRLDVYFKAPRAYLTGIPGISTPARWYNLTVSNPGSYSDVRLDFNDTRMCGKLYSGGFVIAEGGKAARRSAIGCYSGAAGPNVDPGSSVKMQVAIRNYGSSSASGLYAETVLYDWDDTQEGQAAARFRTAFSQVGTGSSSVKEVSFNAPEKPGAYAVRIELYDSAGNLLGILKSRLVVEGVSAHIQNIYSSSLALRRGEAAAFTVLVTPPADGVSSFSAGEAALSLSVLDSSRKAIHQEDSPLLASGLDLQAGKFSFSPQDDISDFYLEASVVHQGRVLDFASLHYSPGKFTRMPVSIEASITNGGVSGRKDYFAEGNPILVNARVVDDYGSQVDSPVTLFWLSSGVYYGGRQFTGSYRVDERIPTGKVLFTLRSGDIRLDKELFIRSAGEEEKSRSRVIYSAVIAVLVVIILVMGYLILRWRKEREWW